MTIFLTILFVVICLMLIGVVLLQKGRGGGLSGAFGGVGGHSAFGSRTGDMFTWITIVLIGLFLVVGTASVKAFRPEIDEPVGEQPADLAPPADAEPGEQAPAATQPTTQPAAATQPAETDEAF